MAQLAKSEKKTVDHSRQPLPKKYFGRFRKPLVELPDLVSGQRDSFRWLLKEGLKEVFQEFSPIRDYSEKKFELEIVKFGLGEPKHDEYYAKENMLSYDAPLKATVRLKNKTLNISKEQDMFLADFPLQTPHGTFIINGVERVIVSQLARSFGVFFTMAELRSKRLFGAKVIPARGAWVEFETDTDGAIYVRIDRKRKFPVTALLRVLGARFDRDMYSLFSSNSHAKAVVESTLVKDPAKTLDDAYIEIHKKLRDGDPASVENARDFINSIFSPERYDLSPVGRHRFNQRFKRVINEEELEKRTLSLDDVVTIVSHVISLNNTPGSEPDDIDHLGFRRVRYVGELLQQRVRVGMSRMKRNIQDRMSTVDAETTLPMHLINPRPLQASIKEFYTTNQLSQFMSQENILAELENLRTLSALGPGGLTRERAGFEVRDVHPSHYGRLCPIHTPEGPNIGLILRLSTYARINNFGMIETPYVKIADGKVTGEIVYLNAHEEEQYAIAHAATPVDEKGNITSPQVEGRLRGEPTLASREEIAFMDVATNQPFSVATSMIPFLEHDDANRALMGSNMQKQATPCLIPEVPLVATGIEERAAQDTGRVILAQEDGVVSFVDAKKIVIKASKGEHAYPLVTFSRTNDFSAFHQRPAVSVGDKVKKGGLLADTSSSAKGQMALGQNARVAFMSWSGANYEDAIIISERLVKDSKFTSIHIEEFEVSVRDTKLGPEVTTHDIPNVGETKLKNLDEEGVVRIGAEVRPGDILVGKVTPKGETQLTPEERLLRSIFGEKAKDVKDTSLRLEGGKRGRIIGVKIFSREKGDALESGIIKRIHVTVAQLRNVAVGDKLAGRHGNKGVISKILPVEDMPYTKDGEPIDVILTPLGVPSRMNLGQILELHLGLAAHTLGYQAIVPPFAGATDEEIKRELKEAGCKENGKVMLYDGRTGEAFNQEVAVGYLYIMKLHHMVEDKIHMRSIGPYSLITQQPLGGKAQNGGQRFGEMEVWALLGYGAAYTLREMLTIKSDDIVGRSAAFDSIVKGEPISHPHTPASFNVLLNNLKGLSLDVMLKSIDEGRGGAARVDKNRRAGGTDPAHFDSVVVKLASPERILDWSYGEVTKPETINYRTQRPEKSGLFDEKIFGPEKDYECYCSKYRGIRFKGITCEKCGVEITRSIVRRERMGHIELASPVSHIWFLRGIPSRISLLLGVSAADVERVIYFAGYLITKVNEEEKKKLLHELDAEYKVKLKQASDEKSLARLKDLLTSAKQDIETIREGAVIDETTYHRYSVKYGVLFEAAIGAEAVYELFKNIDLKALASKLESALEKAGAAERAKLSKRLSLVRAMLTAGIRPEWMFLSVIPVIPPALRPMVALEGGRHATSDLNDLYRRVINRNNRLKKLKEINAPDVILRNEKRILQEAVDALLDNSIRHGNTLLSAMSQTQRRPLKSLADYLKGKQGYFRQNLLGKRVDYSGRSVIVIGAELKLDQCGLPKHMALELFRPFVIAKLLEKELAYNIRGAGRLIDEGVPEVWAILEEVIKDKHVLLNRAPTLHRQGIQAFRPVLIEGNAIQIHPLVCPAFNADFDGDQMAVHVPLSDEAQLEAREFISANRNVLKPGSGDPVVSTKMLDIVLGCYWMTKLIEDEKGEGKYFPTPNSAITAYDFGAVSFRARVKVLPTKSPKYEAFEEKVFETSVGRLLFNSILPSDYPFINEEITNKSMMALVDDLIRRYGLARIPDIVDKIKSFGFRYATHSAITWGLDDIRVPHGKAALVEGARNQSAVIIAQYNDGLLSREERRRMNIKIWHGVKGEIEKLIPAAIEKNGSVYDMWQSGARGSLGNLTQMAGMKGLIQNPRGETVEFPIIASMKEGLTPIEYFITTHGSRKGLTDTALQTAKAGYLTRRLFDVAQDVVVSEEDCNTKEGIIVRKESASGIEVPFAKSIRGRILFEDLIHEGKTLFKKAHLLSYEEARGVEKAGVTAVFVRSPMTCKALRGLCRRCYGADHTTGELIEPGEAVGTVAAQAIGEPGTQLTMRTFHAGGTASVGGDITQGLPRVEEVFEKRMPKNAAIVAGLSGMISEIKDDGKEKTIIVLPDVLEKKGKASAKAKKKETEYTVHFRRMPLVKVGDKVERGDLLTDGSADLAELFKNAGREKTQEYIIREISRIYELQGATISRKHIEVIIKQMFSRRRVKDPGGTGFVSGDLVEEKEYTEANEQAKAKGAEAAVAEQLILGISEVSLSRKSFLSAASFQNTTKVLINAAVRGAEDKLVGLKENVIIGRLIPAGTGYAGSPKHAKIAELQSKRNRVPALSDSEPQLERV